MDEPLSYFVKYKNTLSDTSDNDVQSRVNEMLTSIIDVVGKSDFELTHLDKLQNLKEEILSNIDEFNGTLTEIKTEVDNFIKKKESAYLSKSYQIYENEIKDSSKYILERSLFQSLIYRDDIEKYFISRILKHSNWKHSGMFIRPEHGKYVNEMTASDPLYVVDDDVDLFTPTKLLWGEQYQSRVRYKLIDESKDIIFNNFPSNQINFIVAMNYFNFKPLNVINRYMKELYDVLKPGGVIIFTYNNCNLTLAVQNFEKSFYSYTPESRLKPMIEMLGFTVIESYNEPSSNVSWLEIMKPGNITSLRGGQCIAEINV